MSADETKAAGVEAERRRWFFRSDNGKANMAPPGGKAMWFNLASVALGNGDDMVPEFDIAGVVTGWDWPNPLDGVTVSDLRKAQAEVSKGRWREDLRARDWVGVAIGRALGLDPKDKAAREKIKGCLRIWIENRMFVVVEGFDDHREKRFFVEGWRAGDGLICRSPEKRSAACRSCRTTGAL